MSQKIHKFGLVSHKFTSLDTLPWFEKENLPNPSMKVKTSLIILCVFARDVCKGPLRLSLEIHISSKLSSCNERSTTSFSVILSWSDEPKIHRKMCV